MPTTPTRECQDSPSQATTLAIAGGYVNAHFAMRCDARGVYLRLANPSGGARVFPMTMVGRPCHWDLTLSVEPGTYRYRYYADRGDVTTYVRPDESDDDAVRMDGLDAVLSVPGDRPVT